MAHGKIPAATGGDVARPGLHGRSTLLVSIAAACLALAPMRLAAQDDGEDGAAAPADTWCMTGGVSSLSRTTMTEPVMGPVEAAWTYPKGEKSKDFVEGEALVWRDRVFVAIREAPDRRRFDVLNLRDGSLAARSPVFKTPVPLELCVWNGVVVARTGPRLLEAFRMRVRLLERLSWTYAAGGVLSPPCQAGREIHVRDGDDLVCLAVGRSTPLWRASGRFRGRPSVRGPHVFAVEYGSEGTASVVLLERATGSRISYTDIGHHDGRIPVRECAIPVIVLEKEVIVRLPFPVPLEGGVKMSSVRLRRPEGTGSTLELTTFCELVPGSSVVPGDRGFIAVMVAPGEGPKMLGVLGKKEGIQILASSDRHAEFVMDPVEASVASGVAYFGPCAVDIVPRRILWSARSFGRGVAIPARETVLLCTDTGRIIALREARRDRGRPRWPAAGDVAGAAPPVEVARGRAVLRDGTTLAGSFRIDVVQSTYTGPGAGSRGSLDDLLLAEDADGKIVFAGPDDDAIQGILALAEQEIGTEYVRLALEADRSRDPILMERLIAEACQSGARQDEIAKAEAKLRARQKAQGKTLPDESARIIALAAKLPARRVEALYGRAAGLPPEAPWSLRSDLLRAVLARESSHEAAARAVRQALPAGIVPPQPFDALEWLDVVDATKAIEVEFVSPPLPDDGEITHAERELGSQCEIWRKDLAAFRSPNLLVISPVQSPGRIARCLSVGELVTGTLGRFFDFGDRRRDTRHPLRLLLYESKEEYERESARMTGAPASHLGWTAGHYSPDEAIARMFIPSKRQEFDRMIDVYAHELTHAWIHERCPLFQSAETERVALTPGHWIVEGFATLIESMRFDVRTRSWTLRDCPYPVDAVANTPSDRLIPWKRLFAATALDFALLDHKPSITVPVTRTLGAAMILSETNLFYAQAGAACLYLFETDPEGLRRKLFQYVGDHYAGHGAAMAVQAAFGMDAAALGKKIMEFAAREVARRR